MEINDAANAMDKTRWSDGKPAPWFWIIAVVVFLLGLAIAAWVLGKNREELAKLRHEKEKAKIEKADAEAALAAAKEDEIKEAALARVAAADTQLEDLDLVLKTTKETFAKNLAAANRLRWSDLPLADSSGS